MFSNYVPPPSPIELRGLSSFRLRFLYYWSYRAAILHTYVKREKKLMFCSWKMFIFLIRRMKKKNTKKTRVLRVFSNYYSSTSTPPRNTTQVSFGRRNRILEHKGEFFQFRFCDFEIFWDFENNVIFQFFIIIKIVIRDIIQNRKKTLLGVVEHTLTFRMIPMLEPQAL